MRIQDASLWPKKLLSRFLPSPTVLPNAFFTNLNSSNFLDSVIENIPNMIFVKDAKELRFVRLNKAGEELIGYSRKDLIGKNDYDFFPHEQADFFTHQDREVLRQNKLVDIPQEPIQTRYLGERILHTKKIPLLDEKGRPLYLLGISEDITEKIQAEQQRNKLLQEQGARAEAEKTAQRLAFLSNASAALNTSLDYKSTLSLLARLVVGQMADWCFIDLLDESGSLKSVAVAHKDPAQIRWAEKLRHKYPSNWTSPQSPLHSIAYGQATLYSAISDELLQKFAYDEQHLQILKDMNLCSSMVVPLSARNRTFGSMTFIWAEAQQHYTSMDLSVAQDIAKRASFAIENAQLYERAQEANKAKSSFLANMSHEVRTPLGAMLGFAELMLEGDPLNKTQEVYLNTIIRNGRLLLRIVNEILDLSKVESECISVEKIQFSLSDMLQDVMSLLLLQAKEKGLEFTLSQDPDLPSEIISDPTRFRQILLNVLGNAIKFTAHGSVRVFLSAQKSHDPQKIIIRCVVRDTGIGISAEQEKRLFQPFSQADCSMTRKYGGTGLGLYLSKRLAQTLNGDLIMSESQKGVGSTFILTIEGSLPAPASSEASRENHLSEQHGVSLNGMKILVVDDSSDNRALIKEFLKIAQAHVETAENGLEGMEKALKAHFDVILMDVQMPELDGIAATRQLRNTQYQKPIIALTAHAMKGDREQCLQNGFNDHLAKPINRKVLIQTLALYMPSQPTVAPVVQILS